MSSLFGDSQKILPFPSSGYIPGGTLYGLNSQTITGNSSGAWAMTANGTNQSITLTPSGTGSVDLRNGTTAQTIRIFRSYTDASNYESYALRWSGTTFVFDMQSLGTGVTNRALQIGGASAAGSIQIISGSGTDLRLLTGSTTALVVNGASGNVLLGGLTTNGTGVLQFATATTSAGGIAFSTDTFFYRSSSNTLNADTTSSSLFFKFRASTGNERGNINVGAADVTMVSNAGQIIFQPNSATALTLDTSQTANFAGSVRVSGGSAANSVNGLYLAGSTLSICTGSTNAVSFDSSQNATFAKEVKSTTGLHTATATGTGAVSYNNTAPIVLAAKSVTILTSGGAGADIATITVPSGITRYRCNVSPNYFVYAETASGTLAAASVAVQDTSGGGGTTVCSSLVLPAAASTGTSGVGASNTNVFTSSTLYIRQLANSANAGTCSFYITIFPIL